MYARSNLHRMSKHEDYEAFVEKFKPKLTTDDCYTPEPVYNTVLAWCMENFPSIAGKRIMRPFRPGGDYTKEDYDGAVVIDNPPFSILSKIVVWYTEHNVKFFLFAPGLTLFSRRTYYNITYIPLCVTVKYANGATVSTSFITNFTEVAGFQAVTAPDLYQAMTDLNEDRRVRKVVMPWNVATSYRLSRLSQVGIKFQCSRECMYQHVTKLKGYGIYGGGFLVSQELAKELERASTMPVYNTPPSVDLTQ